MQLGEIILTNSVKAYFSNDRARGHAVLKSPAKSKMVLIYLGIRSDNSQKPLDVNGLLNYMGWTFNDAPTGEDAGISAAFKE